ncbi:MAG: phosphate acyltransferase PlsX [Firmicutes bacterium]|nr:phosphate acyltransferase PlsX [Bacillota bacterium]
MKIIVDVMSGDNAPLEILRGVEMASELEGLELIITGSEETIRETAEAHGISINKDNISVVGAESVITMEDAPLSVVREKSNSSMAVGLKLLAEGAGDAMVSAGNTGALHAGSTLIVRRIKGVKKSAIATILPYKNPTLLMDSGANIEIAPDVYVQFAQMASLYMERIMGVESPRVGLLNIGAEPTKGTKNVVEAYNLLKETPDINFIGNIEGKELPGGGCDVCVTDGFTGNIVLKLTEGCGSFIMSKIKEIYKKNAVTKMSALMVKNGIKKLKNDFDASEYGGAPLLGLSKPVIKAHGSSDGLAIYNAVRQAMRCVDSNMVYEIAMKLVPNIMEQQNRD